MGYSPWWWQAARPFWLSKPVPCGCNRLWLCGESCPYKHAANSTAGNKRTELTFQMVWLFNPIKQLYSHKRLLIYKACATHTHQGIHSVQNLNRTTHTNPSKPSTKNMYTSCSHIGPKSPASVQKKKGSNTDSFTNIINFTLESGFKPSALNGEWVSPCPSGGTWHCHTAAGSKQLMFLPWHSAGLNPASVLHTEETYDAHNGGFPRRW